MDTKPVFSAHRQPSCKTMLQFGCANRNGKFFWIRHPVSGRFDFLQDYSFGVILSFWWCVFRHWTFFRECSKHRKFPWITNSKRFDLLTSYLIWRFYEDLVEFTHRRTSFKIMMCLTMQIEKFLWNRSHVSGLCISLKLQLWCEFLFLILYLLAHNAFSWVHQTS